MIETQIHRVEPFQARDIAGAVGGIYQDAHDCPGEEARAFVNGTFARHCFWSGFLLLVATIEHTPVGFVYGYDSQPGQWWHDTISTAMIAAGKSAWQEGAFELAEIAVAPAVQGRGIGSRLIEAFLNHVPERNILLSTDMEKGHRAQDLYHRFGFVDLVPDFLYPGFDDRAVIMGRPGINLDPM